VLPNQEIWCSGINNKGGDLLGTVLVNNINSNYTRKQNNAYE